MTDHTRSDTSTPETPPRETTDSEAIEDLLADAMIGFSQWVYYANHPDWEGHIIEAGVNELAEALAPLLAADRAAQRADGAETALRELANEHERIADSLAITFQNAEDRKRATWPHRWLVHILRGDLRPAAAVRPDTEGGEL